MRRERFELALERLRSAQWELFERLASEFLAEEFPALRTVASPSGDMGRDAYLYQPDGDETVLLQYSVREDWSSKIRSTAKRVSENFSKGRELVYATNQVLGADADTLRSEIRRDYGLILDLRDRNWFAERVNSSPAREAAAEALAEDIVDPYLAGRGVIESKAVALTGVEARAACVYLALQYEDDTREKGLTKVCFEAMVRAALRDSDSEHRLSRDEVRSRVLALLPAHPVDQVNAFTDSALSRLAKKSIRHWRKIDEFCLTFEERSRLTERLAAIEYWDERLDEQIRVVIAVCFKSARLRPPQDLVPYARVVRLVVDRFLLAQGEAFAAAVHRGAFDVGAIPDLVSDTRKELAAAQVDRGAHGQVPVVLASAAEVILGEPSVEMQRYLRTFADSYTLPRNPPQSDFLARVRVDTGASGASVLCPNAPRLKHALGLAARGDGRRRGSLRESRSIAGAGKGVGGRRCRTFAGGVHQLATRAQRGAALCTRGQIEPGTPERVLSSERPGRPSIARACGRQCTPASVIRGRKPSSFAAL